MPMSPQEFGKYVERLIRSQGTFVSSKGEQKIDIRALEKKIGIESKGRPERSPVGKLLEGRGRLRDGHIDRLMEVLELAPGQKEFFIKNMDAAYPHYPYNSSRSLAEIKADEAEHLGKVQQNRREDRARNDR